MNNQNNQFRKIGKVKSSHGIKGELFLIVFSKDTSWIKPHLKIYLSQDEKQFSPQILKKVKPHKDGVIVSIDAINTRNESDLLIGQLVWVEPDVFTSKDQESLYLVEIEGFEIIDEKLKSIGRIQGFSSNGIQDLLLVQDGQNEYEIPFVKEFIVDIDYKTKKIRTQLPEGLLDINSSDEDDEN